MIQSFFFCLWVVDCRLLLMMNDAVLIERSKYDDDDVLIERSEYDDDVFYRKKKSECDDDYDRQIRIWWWWCCCWSKGQGAKDVVVDRKVKVLKMLPIESSKCWRCRCWSNSQIVEDVADRKVQVLKMSLLIERSKCWRYCCWSKGPSAEYVTAKLKDQNAEDVVDDEDWRLKMKTTWCWKASNDL